MRCTQPYAFDCEEKKQGAATQQGEQSTSDVEEIDETFTARRCSSMSFLKEIFEIVGSKNCSWQFL